MICPCRTLNHKVVGANLYRALRLRLERIREKIASVEAEIAAAQGAH